MTGRTLTRLAAAGVLAAASVAPGAVAQDWPARPVKIVAPFAPGGSADTLGRMVAEKLSVRLNQNFVVENRPGAGGVIGSEAVAKAPPDGYTLVVSGIASHVIAPAMNPAPFDPLKSFTHIALFGGPPVVFVVHPGLEARNLDEFIGLSKSRAGGLSYGSPGQGTQGHLTAEILKAQSGANLTHVPYKGAALAMSDLMGGHIPAVSSTLTTAATQIKAGKARALALSSARRLPDFPDVPTFGESGYPELVATVWFSLSGPAGLPPAIVSKLNAEVRDALKLPEVRRRLESDGVEPNDLDAAAFTAFVRAEIERWTPLARAVK
ncbi:MAG TPA: tripartite tricarboxylate transporter substrate binding protein [Burkholderiales bacterium]|nr:tripartite tricarboxylate transporter substrate binding protein [Burkholderiales bacterium]